jgi:hypothetical protein
MAHDSPSKPAQKHVVEAGPVSSMEQALRAWAERDQAVEAENRRRLQSQCCASWRRPLIVES